MLLHNSNIGEVLFVQKFLDRLKYNISNDITLHKPRIVDVVLSLALMQEDLLEASTRRFSQRLRENRYTNKSANITTKSPSPNPGILGSPLVNEKIPTKPKWDEKLSALRSTRRAKGSCMKFGEPYNPHHRCPKQVPLHVLKELLELFHLDPSGEVANDNGSQDSDEELLSLSYCAAVGIQGKKTMRLQGTIQN